MIPGQEPVPREQLAVPSPGDADLGPGELHTAGGGEAPAGGAETPTDTEVSADPARWVAVLIMVVTLLGAVFAFLQSAASNRAAAAGRRADAAAVEAQGEAVRSADRLGAQWRIWTLTIEELQIALSLAGSQADGLTAFAQGSSTTAMAMASFVGFDPAGDFPSEWQGLFERTWAPVYRAAEWQKAYGSERSAWGTKGNQYLAVVTVLAVALFLLGLSRTPAAVSSGSLLVWAGVAVAGVASVWGLTVFLRPVAAPSAEAIEAFVEGEVALGSASDLDDLQTADGAFTRALALRPDYAEAHFQRGLARSQLDLFRDGGPVGSAAAREDFERVVVLDPLNPVAWNNLAVARLWLGDLDGAVDAARRATRIDPDHPLASLNLALFLLFDGETAGYQAQLSVIQEIFGRGDIHPATRAYHLANIWGELDVVESYRPEYGAAARRAREDLLRLDHQLTVAEDFFGAAIPPEVAAEISPLSFTASADGTLQVAFDAIGVAAGQRWLWRTYLSGVEDETLSHEPEVWPFAVPDEQVTITLTAPDGFAAGVPVRVEVFIEGNLLQAGEYTP